MGKNRQRELSKQRRSLVGLASITVVTLLVTGCGASVPSASTAASGSAVALSGSLSASAGSARIMAQNASHKLSALAQVEQFFGIANKSVSVNYTGYTISCATSDVPPVVSTGTITSGGGFTLSVDGGQKKDSTVLF